MNNSLIELKERGDSLSAVDKKSANAIEIRGSKLIKTNSHETALSLVRQGLGVVLVMEKSAKEDLATRRLVKVFPSCNFGHLELELKVRDSLPSPPTRAFVNFMKAQAKV